ncbi:hypothetical protein WICPIJ_004017 [Wickerhamomyces pijperi]|uniref:Stress response protein NST1 n=1 Tax=Wickerhamomyces pijperi TaxID=599730 RepID=A0A9P8Q8P6_WICPI|nr:hypothetical protein WICPIJ_004017 [Wickerhamomyces pijperi]
MATQDANEDDNVLVNGNNVQFEYNENGDNELGGNKKKRKKKNKNKSKQQASNTGSNQHVIGQDLNLDDPELDYPDSRVLKQDANGDVIVQPLNHETISPIPSASAASKNSEKSNNKNNTLKSNSASVPTDPALLNEELKKYWLTMPLAKKREMLQLERESVFTIMKEQQQVTCNCSVCGKKRDIIEQELKRLYDKYSNSIESQDSITHSLFDTQSTPTSSPCASNNNTANHQHSHNGPNHNQQQQQNSNQAYLAEQAKSQKATPNSQRKPSNSDSTTKEKTGLMSVAEDLLQNDGKKFLEMMEKLAESRIQRGQNQNQKFSKNSNNNLINSNQADEEENSNYLNDGEDDYDESDFVLKDASIAADGEPIDSTSAIPRDMIIPQKIPLEALCNSPNYNEEEDPDYELSASGEDDSEDEYPDGEDDGDDLYQELDGLKEDLSKPVSGIGAKQLHEFQVKIKNAVRILGTDGLQSSGNEILNEVDSLLYHKLQEEFDHENTEDFKDIFPGDNTDSTNPGEVQSMFNPSTKTNVIKRIEELSDGEYELQPENDEDEGEEDEGNDIDAEEEPYFGEPGSDSESYNSDQEGYETILHGEECNEQENGDDVEEDLAEVDDSKPKAIDEEEQLSEGRAMLQLCTAKMLRQRLLESYKEMKHQEYLSQLIKELDEEEMKKNLQNERKNKKNEKKKEKKRSKQADKERLLQEKRAEEERIRLEKEAESRKKQEARRQRKLEEERKKAEEKQRRQEATERNRLAREAKRKAEEEAQRLEQEAQRQKEEQERKAKEELEFRLAEEKRLKEEKEQREAELARKAEEDQKKLLMRQEELRNNSPFLQNKAPLLQNNLAFNGYGSSTALSPHDISNNANLGLFAERQQAIPQTKLQQALTSSQSNDLFSPHAGFLDHRQSEPAVPPLSSAWGNDSISAGVGSPFNSLNNGRTSSIFNHQDNFHTDVSRQLTPDRLPPFSSQLPTGASTPVDLINNGVLGLHMESPAPSLSRANDNIDPFASNGTAGFASSKLWGTNGPGTSNWAVGNNSGWWNSSSSLNVNNTNVVPSSDQNYLQPQTAPHQPNLPSSAQSNASNNSQFTELIQNYKTTIYHSYLKWSSEHSEAGFITIQRLNELWVFDNPAHATVSPDLFRMILENRSGYLDFEIFNDDRHSPMSFTRIGLPSSANNPGLSLSNPSFSQSFNGPSQTHHLNGSGNFDSMGRSNSNPYNVWGS